jgi:ArpU family phage transcriptional regulator
MKPFYKQTVERRLYEYPLLKQSIKNAQVWEEFMPSLTPSYEERTSPSYSEYVSSTERFGILRAMKQIQLQEIEEALACLTVDEQAVVRERYLNPVQPPDSVVMDTLGIGKSKYYQIKSSAISKMAKILNVV